MRIRISVEFDDQRFGDAGPRTIAMELIATGGGALTMPTLDELARAFQERREIEVRVKGLVTSMSGNAR